MRKKKRTIRSLYALFLLAAVFLIPVSSDAGPLDTWTQDNQNPPLANVYGMAFGNNVVVAVGDSGKIYTYNDIVVPREWKQGTVPGGFSANLHGVAFGNGIFIAVGPGGKILRSTDGASWADVSPNPAAPDLFAVSHGNNCFVAVGADGTVLVSSADGMTWTEPSWTGQNPKPAEDLNGVAFGANLFVVIGGNAVGGHEIVYTSVNPSDAAAWQNANPSALSGRLNGVAYGNNLFVAVGANGRYFKYDVAQAQWTYGNAVNTTHLYGVAFGNKNFVAVGAAIGQPAAAAIRVFDAAASAWTAKTASNITSDLYAVAYAPFSTSRNYFYIAGLNFIIYKSGEISAAISVSPFSSIDFASINVGSTATRTIIITNTGTADLVIGTISLSGSNEFAKPAVNDNCSGQTKVPSATCTIAVTFSPTSGGLKTANLSISSNDPQNPSYNLQLSGTGVQYTLTVAGTGSNSTGTVTGGNGINCSIAANGTGSGTCAETRNPGAQITLTATFPTGTHVVWTGCNVATGSTCSVTLDNNKTVTAVFTLDPVLMHASLDFGQLMAGSVSKPREVTVLNNGDTSRSLTISLTGADPGMFSLAPGGTNPCPNLTPTIGAGGNCTVTVTYYPVVIPPAGREATATLDVRDNGNPYGGVTVRGTATAASMFGDISLDSATKNFIYTFYNYGITGGCGAGIFCPNDPVTRAQMAVFLEAALGHSAKECANRFSDVPAGSFACGFIERLADDGITGGCGGGKFCPGDSVTRAQMAVFMEAALQRAPAASCTGKFNDVSAATIGDLTCRYIEDFSVQGITGGCQADDPSTTGVNEARYCPNDLVTREQMAVFMVMGFHMGTVSYPNVSVSPSSLNFGSLTQGSQSPQQTVTITNSGVAALTINEITLSDTTNYILSTTTGTTACGSLPKSVAPGGSCTVSVSFRPASLGTFNATLTIVTSDPETPSKGVTLTGTGGTQIPLTVNKAGSGTGTVTSSPAGINCGSDCSETYPQNTAVTLTAVADSGSTFTGWSGEGCSGTGICSVTMSAARNVTATFDLPTSISYKEIVLADQVTYYMGFFSGESIGAKPARKYYKVTRPVGTKPCNTVMNPQLAGNVGGYVNANMLVSDHEFGTDAEALAIYQQLFNVNNGNNGYDNTVVKETINGRNYWHKFVQSYEAEDFNIDIPTASVYYIMIINEDPIPGYNNVKASCY